MNVRCKCDGGKFVNRSQSGSCELRCMGAGLQHNMRNCWGPKTLSEMTTTCINSVYQNVMECSTKKTEVDRKRRATDEAKSKQQQSKYSRKDDSIKAYSRHDDGVLPDEVEDDISPEHLADLTDLYYKSNVVVTIQEAIDIEIKTRGQGENDLWKEINIINSRRNAKENKMQQKRTDSFV